MTKHPLDCPYCGAREKHDRRVCRMKALHADPDFAAANRERMKKLHADPDFAAANRERSRERMKALNADPDFAAANRERMKALNADPDFAAANRERMKKLNADPDFAAANRERMKKLHADPDHNPLVLLTKEERADYDLLKRNGYSREEALAAIRRHDLLPKAAE